MEIDIDKAIFEEISEEGNHQVHECEEFLRTYIIDCYPEVLAEVQTKRASKALLHYQKRLIEDIYEDGLIKQIEFEKLKEIIDSSIRTLLFQGLPTFPILRDIFTNRFSAAESSEILSLMSKISEKKYKPGEIIFKEGDPANGAYYIIRGRVNEKSS